MLTKQSSITNNSTLPIFASQNRGSVFCFSPNRVESNCTKQKGLPMNNPLFFNQLTTDTGGIS